MVSEENVVFSLDPSEVIENGSYPCWDVRDSPQVMHDVFKAEICINTFSEKEKY